MTPTPAPSSPPTILAFKNLNVSSGKVSTSSPQIPPLSISWRHPPTVHFRKSPNFRQILCPSPPTTANGSLPCKRACCKTCPIHIPTKSFTSPNTGLTYPITTLADCKSSNLIYQLQCKKVKLFTLGKQVRCSQNVWMGTGPLARSRTLTCRYPSTPNPTSSLSRNVGPSALFINSRPRTPPTWNCLSTSFEIPQIPWYKHPITSPDLPHTYFPFPP